MENNKPLNNTQNNNTNTTKPSVTNEKMAVKFPDWDLLPPALLVKRGKNESYSLLYACSTQPSVSFRPLLANALLFSIMSKKLK